MVFITNKGLYKSKTTARETPALAGMYKAWYAIDSTNVVP